MLCSEIRFCIDIRACLFIASILTPRLILEFWWWVFLSSCSDISSSNISSVRIRLHGCRDGGNAVWIWMCVCVFNEHAPLHQTPPCLTSLLHPLRSLRYKQTNTPDKTKHLYKSRCRLWVCLTHQRWRKIGQKWQKWLWLSHRVVSVF